MIAKFKKPIIAVVALSLGLWVANSVFNYFSFNTKPVIKINGIAHNQTTKDTINLTISAHNDYKIDSVTVTLDDTPLESDQSTQVKARTFSLPFSIDSTTLPNGEHSLTVSAIDASYNHNRFDETLTITIDNTQLTASFLEKTYKVQQGKTLHAKLQTNKDLKVATLSFGPHSYKCHKSSPHSTQYECFIPICCEEHPDQHTLLATLEDSAGHNVQLTAQIEVTNFNFAKQKHSGSIDVSQEKLDEEREVSMNAKILDQAIEKWVEQSPREKLWTGAFELPTEVQRISTPHGEIRVTPIRGRYMHNGIDIVNHPRSVVWASQNGKIIIKDRYLLTGNTIAIDHGLGVVTLYAHLENFADVEVGDMVKKGNPIGQLGMTGYATGYHLHWELRVNNISVDPLEWTQKIY